MPVTVGGYFDFDHLEDMAEEALSLSGAARGVYFTLNPLNRDLLARCCNRTTIFGKGDSASDDHVLHRRWLFVDLDPYRVGGISSTDAEKLQAWERIQQVLTWVAQGPLPR